MPKKFNVILVMMVTATGTNLELLSYFDNDGQWDQFGTTVDHAIEVQNNITMVTRTNFNLVHVA